MCAEVLLEKGEYDAAIVLVDGLSAPAVHRHAMPLLEALTMRLAQEDWRLAPLTVVLQGRMAIGTKSASVSGRGRRWC